MLNLSSFIEETTIFSMKKKYLNFSINKFIIENYSEQTIPHTEKTPKAYFFNVESDVII